MKMRCNEIYFNCYVSKLFTIYISKKKPQTKQTNKQLGVHGRNIKLNSNLYFISLCFIFFPFYLIIFLSFLFSLKLSMTTFHNLCDGLLIHLVLEILHCLFLFVLLKSSMKVECFIFNNSCKYYFCVYF